MRIIHKNYINGAWIESSSDEIYNHLNPADLSEITGVFKKSNIKDTLQAVAAAKAAFGPWATLNSQKYCFQISDIQLLSVDFSNECTPSFAGKYLIGHTVGEHSGTYIEDDNMLLPLRLFRSSKQGNLAVFLISARKTGYLLNLDAIDVDYIRKSGLKVAMRYYGANKGPLLGDIQFRDRVKRFVERLGDAFVSFGPHEQHLMMDKCIEEVGEEGPQACSEEYRKYFRKRIKAIRQISEAPIWDTDPSFYSHFHMQESANQAAVEFTVGNCSLLAASARGTTIISEETCLFENSWQKRYILQKSLIQGDIELLSFCRDFC